MSGPRAIYAAFSGWYQQVITLLGSIASIPLLIEILGKEKAGLWFTVLSIFTLLQYVDFGFSASLARQVAFSYRSNNERMHSRNEFMHFPSGQRGIGRLAKQYKFFLNIAQILIALGTIVACTMILLMYDQQDGEISTSDLIFYGITTAISATLAISAKFRQAILEGIGDLHIVRFAAGTQQAILHGTVVVVASIYGDLRAILTVFTLLQLLNLLVISYLVRLRTNSINSKQPTVIRQDKIRIRQKIWKVSFPLGLIAFGAGITSAAQVPVIAFAFGPQTATELYTVMKVTQALTWAVGLVVIAQAPIFTEKISQHNWSDATRMLYMTCLIGTTAYAGLATFLLINIQTIMKLLVNGLSTIDQKTLNLIILNFFLAGSLAIPACFVLASGRRAFYYSTPLHGIISLIGTVVFANSMGVMSVPLSFLTGLLVTNLWVNIAELIKLHSFLDRARNS